MSLPRLTFPFRLKIAALVVAALVSSFAAYIWLGSSMLIQDRVAYIYDFNLVRLNSAGSSIEGQLDHTMSVLSLLGRAVDPKAIDRTRERWDEALTNTAKTLGISGAIGLRMVEGDRFELILSRGENAARAIEAVDLLGWRPSILKANGAMVGSAIRGLVPVAVATFDANGEHIACVALIQFNPKILGEEVEKQAVRLIDLAGYEVISHSAVTDAPSEYALAKLEKNILASGFPAGVRDLTADGRDYIVAYRRISFGTLLLVSYVSKSIAFSTARSLVQRSTALGMGLLLLAVGFTILLVGAATRRIRDLWSATRQIGAGDFSVRVEEGGRVGDEISGLANSFNTMASKIGELMKSTADKARMEKELETAQLVQSRFFPVQGFSDSNFLLSGNHRAASECGGDWWGYAQIGNRLIVVIGDVTGHGVSAALVTAAAYSAFAIYLEAYRSDSERFTDDLQALIQHINTAVFAASTKNCTMTFVASVLELDSGRMRWVNASHPAPYVRRKVGGSFQFDSLVSPPAQALGVSEKYDADVHETVIVPGETVIWYTDGIFENRESDGAKLSKGAFLRLIGPIIAEHPADAKGACTRMMENIMGFLDHQSGARSDDVTLLVGTVPENAQTGKRVA